MENKGWTYLWKYKGKVIYVGSTIMHPESRAVMMWNWMMKGQEKQTSKILVEFYRIIDPDLFLKDLKIEFNVTKHKSESAIKAEEKNLIRKYSKSGHLLNIAHNPNKIDLKELKDIELFKDIIK